MSGGFDPLVPREIDLPTHVPLDIDVREGEAAERLDDAKIFAAPDDPADVPRWREQLSAWREGARLRHGAPTRYDDPRSAWSSRCFTIAQVWLWDEQFFDFDEQRFTPERFLEDARVRFGGLDGVVLWHAYPVIGIDDRNQWDYYRAPGLREAAETLRSAGIAVFVDYNPWDTGTRRGGDDASELAAVVRELGADGVFLDTLKKAEPDLIATLDAARPGIGLEGESKLATERIADHTLSWAQWFADTDPPGVLRARWFERRHMQHHIRRWHRDHSAELRSAWINGVGMMVWEVVFGVWVGWNPRDAGTLRRMLPVQRTFHRWLTDGHWMPLAVTQGSVTASSFTLDGVALYTFANSGDEDVSYRPAKAGTWIGLHDDAADAAPPTSFVVPAHGIAAAVLVTDGAQQPAEVDIARRMLSGVSHERDASFAHRRPERLTPPRWGGPTADATERERARRDTVVAAAGQHSLTVRYRARETGMYDGAPYVDEWKPLPPRLHDLRTMERLVELRRPVRVATREVSEKDYDLFLHALGEASDFDAPSDERPATRVTLAKARAYAAWLGGRLPSEDEWQLAAALPGFERRRPQVWNWTESEHSDGRSRFVMLKGGSVHRSEGSDWYFDGGVKGADFAAKLLLPGLGVDASTSIGFRVCWDEDL
ncbi:SUMF1/EgtB/PvdO family nonheme iron enzyme [Microbacterium invictum]|uniref:SUMF1/EgtB/PvdO family nonheme iron enzyme n=1 Tax=Microbacterium invictum TaxID=515415 RepID=A0ABZ0VCI6_9MICO|nr:SUMF1/EgtB/PvdO family nonheme iron enzyme [Microbacterium invictum]WQB69840.1 SUMF1/EgtB/PvdO family nonheme iron enzyme [Microbacterium invictum]